MTVKELIDKLKQYDDDIEVTIDVCDDEGNSDILPITDVDIDYDVSSHSDVVKLYY